VSFLFPGWAEHVASKMTIEAALRDIVRGSPKARALAAQRLGDATDPVEKHRASLALISALEDERPEVRAEACVSLGELREPSAVTHLIRKLDDGVPVVRQNAAIALGTLGQPEGFTPLAEALASGPADLRFQAATSLAEIDAPRAYDLLVPALDDKDPQVVAAAALSLGAIGDPRAIPALRGKLDHKDPGARFDVAYALADLKDAAGRAVLGRALVDDSRAWDAITALANLGTAEDAELLAPLLANRRDNKPTPQETQVLAAGAILKIAPDSKHTEEAKRVLLGALTARKMNVRGLAVEQLGATAGDWAKQPLEKLAKSGKGVDLLETIATAIREIDARRKLAEITP
jgi:HEAT repeat protein